ncbi:unnamed protein product, partial [marine sediment metagenome]
MPLWNPYDVKSHSDLDTGVHGVGESTVCSETEADDKIAAKVSSGSYEGDDADNRAIAHGLGVVPKVVLIIRVGHSNSGFVTSTTNINTYNDVVEVVTNWDTTNFYVSNTTVNFNGMGVTYN